MPASRPATRTRRNRKTTARKGRDVSRAQSVPKDTSLSTPKHEEKITFYCTKEDLLALEHARLRLRAEFGVSADRGRIVRAALAYVLDDFDARGKGSVVVRELKK